MAQKPPFHPGILLARVPSMIDWIRNLRHYILKFVPNQCALSDLATHMLLIFQVILLYGKQRI